MHLQDNRYADNIAEQIKKGTTTCALTCVDGVVFRMTLGQVQVFSLQINTL